MSLLTTYNQPYLVEWLCKRIGLQPSPDFKAIGSVTHEGQRLRGVVGYDGYNGSSVVMHMAGEPGWLDKTLLHAAFDYPFNVLDCNQVLAFVPSGNDVALDIDKRLGFEVACELDGAHPDGSLFVLRMRREQCKWIAPRETH